MKQIVSKPDTEVPTFQRLSQCQMRLHDLLVVHNLLMWQYTLQNICFPLKSLLKTGFAPWERQSKFYAAWINPFWIIIPLIAKFRLWFRYRGLYFGVSLHPSLLNILICTSLVCSRKKIDVGGKCLTYSWKWWRGAFHFVKRREKVQWKGHTPFQKAKTHPHLQPV